MIAELQGERRRLLNVDGLVLTVDGRPVDKLQFEYHFRKTRGLAGIRNFTFHDFRHCAITRWAAAGIPTAAFMFAAVTSQFSRTRNIRISSAVTSRMLFRIC